MEFYAELSGRDSAVIRTSGRLNLVTAPNLRDLVTRTVGHGRSYVVVDMAETDFMDSSGPGALVSGLKTARAGLRR